MRVAQDGDGAGEREPPAVEEDAGEEACEREEDEQAQEDPEDGDGRQERRIAPGARRPRAGRAWHGPRRHSLRLSTSFTHRSTIRLRLAPA